MIEPATTIENLRYPSATLVLVDVGSELGMSVGGVLAGTGLTADDLADPELLVAPEQELRVARNLVRHTGDRPGVGALVGSRVTLGMLGIWGTAMMSSRTTRDMIDVAYRFGYGRFSWAFLRPTLQQRPTEMEIVWEDDHLADDLREFLIERDLAFSTSLIPVLFGRALPVRLITKLSEKRAGALGAALPGFEVTGGANRNAQVVDNALLDAPLPNFNEYAVRTCQRQCEELLSRRVGRAGVSQLVRSVLLRNPARRPSLEEVAAEHHVDPRTIRRQLATEGTSFRKLTDEVQETLATELLTSGLVTVEQVAHRLGYADAATFTRAYKRWTGSTPGVVARGA